MTDPATPRSSRYGTPDINSDGDTPGQSAKTPEMMTPGRKIQAMLAQFDSDSDSGNGRETAPKPRNQAPTTESTSATRNMTGPFEEHADLQAGSGNDDDVEELPPAPRGKLAARMQGGVQSDARSPPARKTQQSGGSSSQTLKNLPDAVSNEFDNDSEDDIRAAGRRRRAVQSSPSPSPSEASRRSASPLFVPARSPTQNNGQEEPNSGDEPEQGRDNNAKNSRFQELLARKRKEREEKERIEEEKRAARIQRSSDLGIEFSDDGGDVDDDQTGQKLTQQSKPTARKASKKAVLEMNRETQRMNRNMQLAHQATTKKKFTLDGFMARFNRPESKDGSATAASSHHPSDTEARHPDSTPPTSPPPPLNPEGNDLAAKLDSQANLNAESGTSQQPALESTKEVRAQSVPAEQNQTQEPPKEAKPNRKSVRVKLSPRSVAQTQNHDSDSDLEVVTSPSKARKLAIFENLKSRKSRQSQSLQTLRALANLSGASRNTLSEMNQADLEATLLRKAREQAAQEREEKIRRLREKGVVVQTAEERNRTENDVEDLMQKAREEAESVAKQEKAAAKKNGEENGGDALDDDSDEDYDGDQGEPDEDEIDSEEEDDEPNDEDDKVQVKQSSDLVDNQAEETGESESEAGDNEGNHPEPDEVNGGVSQRTGRKKFVVSDEEDGDEEPPLVVSTPKPQAPNLGKSSGDFLGLSQAFAATLANSQDETEEDSLAKLREMSGVDLPAPDVLEPDSQGIIRDSQDQQSGSFDLLGDYTQTGVGVADSPSARTFTQYSQAPEPTQDAGFVMSPFDQQKRFSEQHPTSTIDTVPLNPEETPLAKKGMRRLRRGQQTTHVSDDEEVSTNKSAFDVMRKNAKKPQTPYDKKKSKAKDIVDEAAEESEDEYAGLGGASDEDSGAEDDYDRGMINDESGEVVDEKELAALNANFDRERDERDVNKLMKDITTGGLRRKRAGGDDFDLSESEDERVEARRRAKRREFAKMRKALLEDDKLSKMADDPKKAAFLRSIEDRDFGNEKNFLVDEYGVDNDTDNHASQENSNGQEGQDGTESGLKRPLDQTSADTLNRPPAKLRRKAATKKPTSLAEIRQSVSFLLDEPETREPGSPPPDDEEPKEQNDEDELSRSDTTVRRGVVDNPTTGDAEPNDNRQTGEVTYNNPRRRRGAAVVDRLSLRRAASSNATSAASSKPAFYTSGSGNASPSFNGPPPLLSRKSTSATTTAASATSLSSNRSSGAGKPEVTAGGAGGGKKAAAVNYYAAAREKAREVELKRKDNERRERRLGLGAMKGHGDRLKGLLGGQKSGQWE